MKAFGLLAAVLFLQDDPAALVEKLRSENVVERDEATRQLRALGDRALPALLKVEFDADPEVAGRARRLLQVDRLRKQLSPATLTLVPNAAESLAFGEDRDWTAFMLRILKSPNPSRSDLSLLAPRAVAGARKPSDLHTILHDLGHRRIRSISGRLVEMLALPDKGSVDVARHALVNLQEIDDLPALVRLAADHPSEEVRVRAIDLLGTLGTDKEIPFLLSLLEDPQPGIRNRAAEALGELGAPDLLRPLLKLLERPGSSRTALALLGDLHDPETLPVFLKYLRTGDAAERARAAASIQNLSLPQAIPALRGALKEDPSAEVQYQAAMALCRLGDRDSFDPLLAMFRKDPVGLADGLLPLLLRLDDARAGAVLPVLAAEDVDGLGKSIFPKLYLLLPFEPRPELLALLDDERDAVRKRARDAALKSLPTGSLPLLLKLLESPDVERASHAATLLGYTRCRGAMPSLKKLLADPRLDLRSAAINALGQMKAIDVAPDLARLLREDPVANDRARWALLEMGAGETLRPYLLDPLRCPPERAYEAMIQRYYLDGRSVLPEFVPLLDRPGTRRSALSVLSTYGLDPLPSKVVDLLDDPEARGSAVWAASQRPVPAMAPGLRRRLKDGDAQTREYALKGLAKLADRDSLPEWMERLTDIDDTIREAAAEAVARAAGPREIERLGILAGSRDLETRMGALRALRLLHRREEEPLFVRAMADPIAEVRVEAVRGLAGIDPPVSLEVFLGAMGDRAAQVRSMGLAEAARRWSPAVAEAVRLQLRSDDLWLRLGAAEQLCRHGDPSGVPFLLAQPHQIESLNGVRSPKLWERLRSTRFDGPVERHVDLIDRVAALAGLGVERKEGHVRSGWWGPRPTVERPSTLLDALDLLDSNPYSETWILEEDRIRVVHWAEALRFWRAWAEKPR